MLSLALLAEVDRLRSSGLDRTTPDIVVGESMLLNDGDGGGGWGPAANASRIDVVIVVVASITRSALMMDPGARGVDFSLAVK